MDDDQKARIKHPCDVTWNDHGRESRYSPDPRYPDGFDVDASNGAEPVCFVSLPYPARRCGSYIVSCRRCGVIVAVTTAGRPDDPRSVTLACRAKGTA